MLIGTITILTILFFGGGAGMGTPWALIMGDLAPEVIQDEERLERAEQASSSMRQVLDEFERSITAHRAGLSDMDGDYYATEADYRRVYDKLEQDWDRRMTRLIELRYEFRDQFTREEWTKLIQLLEEKLKE